MTSSVPGLPDLPLLEIGRIDKPHGLKGELVVTLTTDRAERTEPGATWILDAGPARVETARPHQHRWVVRLSTVATREDAEAVAGQVLRAEPIEDPDALWVHELVGAQVRTPDGRTWGTVVAVLANPADDLLELDDGSLVPVGFVVDASGLPASVTVEVPEGLLGTDAET